MNQDAKQAYIRAKATEHKVKWSSHALGELIPEGLGVTDVESRLQTAVVIEDYAHAHRYLPDCLVLTFKGRDIPIHAVVAINEPGDYVLVVTVYCPTAQEWHNDWRTRK